MENVKEGTKFIVIKDFPTHAFTSWGKPYTGSEDCVIPKQTIIIAESDQIDGALAFGVIPEKYKEMEPQFISSKTLVDKDYGGYHFIFYNEDYGRYFIYLDESKNDPSKYATGEKIPAKNTLVFKDGKTLKMIKNPTKNDVEKMVKLFIPKNVSEVFIPGYIIISQIDTATNITILSREKGFHIEYQEGSERHKINGFFNVEKIIKILISYLDGADDWKKHTVNNL